MQDQNLEKTNDMTPFFSANYSMTTSCLARAIVNNVLTGDCVTNISENHDVLETNEMCKIT